MSQNFVSGGPADQMFLLPPDARESLPAGLLAWPVLEQAGRLDLTPFPGWYRAGGQGRPAYHPGVMVALVVYCYCKGIRSSRAVGMATFDDAGARVITGNLHPGHATTARFVTRHEQAVKGLLVASLAACAKEGLASVEVVAGDGTKVKAGASGAANVTGEQLDLEIAELVKLIAAEVDGWLAQARAEDAAGDALPGGGDGGPGRAGGPGTLARTAGTLVRRQRARTRLAAEAAARQEDAAAARAEKTARLERRTQRHHARAAALEAQATARVADYQRRARALHPALKLARANLDAAGITDPAGSALSGAGYASDGNFTTSCEPQPCVAVTRDARQAGRLRDGRKPAKLKESWQQMTGRLATPEGKALCKRRSAIIEPVFARLFARLGRHLNYRDTRVNLELHLWAATRNFLKAIRAPARHPAPAT